MRCVLQVLALKCTNDSIPMKPSRKFNLRKTTCEFYIVSGAEDGVLFLSSEVPESLCKCSSESDQEM